MENRLIDMSQCKNDKMFGLERIPIYWGYLYM